ncbi:MAG: phytoene/squalene synthase family protein, partial [Polyangiaceae bacterium]
MTSPTAIAVCTEVLERKSKSFALAARLLGRSERDAIAVIYAFCRHVDDAIDLAPPADRPRALDQIRREVDDVFAARTTGHVVLDAFAVVARAYRIPRTYVDELVAGMTMDVERARYRTRDELLLYAYRVAGVVGLLLCHVMGLRDARALPRAAHLGIAMQITNICRDVAEDLEDGRSYLPLELLGFELQHRPAPGSAAHGAVVHAVER